MLLWSYNEDIKWILSESSRANHNKFLEDFSNTWHQNLKKLANFFKFQSISIRAICSDRRQFQCLQIVFHKKTRWLVLEFDWSKGCKGTFSCPLGLLHCFLGVLRCLSQLSVDKVKAGHCCFKRHGPRGRFLADIRIHCSIFLSNTKKYSPLVPFTGQLGKIFKNIFSLKSRLATTPSWQIQLTRRVHSQKFPLKYNALLRLCTHLVSRICHARTVAHVDFK